MAIPASVTVSIAAETRGMRSSTDRVKRVAVETSFGRTCDSAGSSSTSSKVRPFACELGLERQQSLDPAELEIRMHLLRQVPMNGSSGRRTC